MSEKIVIPELGTTVKRAKISKWLCKEGQLVEKGESVCEIETEKVTLKVESPIRGILFQIIKYEGQIADVGEVIALIVEEDKIPDKKYKNQISFDQEEAIAQKLSTSASESTEKVESIPFEKKHIKITPIAKKIAKEKKVDVTLISGSGPHGRIQKKDVLDFLRKKIGVGDQKMPAKDSDVYLGATILLTKMREIIGERLTKSSKDVPHVYFSSEVDCSELIDVRSKFIGIIEQKTGKRISYNDFIIKAVAMCIEKHPIFNATIENKAIKVNESINIGFALALEDGLIVPVIKDANQKTLSQILNNRLELIQKAQNKKLTIDELSGGTFTVSNLGKFDVDFFTSIINPPETAILSVPKMKERPFAEDGKIVIRQTIKLGLAADHRVVDGANAAYFLQEICTLLKNPLRMCNV
jgi:pyruvate dehydrogenase E2 component (dihydrolipoamide acetyltransferase)